MLKNGKRGVRNALVLLAGSALVGGSVLVATGEAFAVTTPPVAVTALSVKVGSTAGGSSTLITGRGFSNITSTDATSVKFGSNNASNFIVLSDTQIAAVAPAGTGTVDVVVHDGATTPNTSAVVTADKFTYVAPITAAVPANTLLNPLGGSAVTVTASGTGVSLGASASAFAALNITGTVNGVAAPLTWVSATTVKMTVPAGTPSNTAVKVMLLNQGVTGTADSTNAKYAAVISKLSVVSGPKAGGGTVAVTGKGLLSGTAWKFGSTSATCTVSSDTAASCTIPAGASAGAVSVNFTPASSVPFGTTAGATYTYTDVS